MKDFFGTVIEPGDAVVVAWGKASKGSTAGTLEQCTAHRRVKGEGIVLYRNSDGRRCSFGIGPHNVISMKSVK